MTDPLCGFVELVGISVVKSGVAVMSSSLPWETCLPSRRLCAESRIRNGVARLHLQH